MRLAAIHDAKRQFMRDSAIHDAKRQFTPRRGNSCGLPQFTTAQAVNSCATAQFTTRSVNSRPAGAIRNVLLRKTNLLKIFCYFRAIESNQRSPGREEKKLLSPRTSLTTRDSIREDSLVYPRVGTSGAYRTHPDSFPIPSALCVTPPTAAKRHLLCKCLLKPASQVSGSFRR